MKAHEFLPEEWFDGLDDNTRALMGHAEKQEDQKPKKSAKDFTSVVRSIRSAKT